MQQSIQVFGIIYFSIGFVYASYILLFAGDKWYAFPVNFLAGPLQILYIIFKTLKNQRMPYWD